MPSAHPFPDLNPACLPRPVLTARFAAIISHAIRLRSGHRRPRGGVPWPRRLRSACARRRLATLLREREGALSPTGERRGVAPLPLTRTYHDETVTCERAWLRDLRRRLVVGGNHVVIGLRRKRAALPLGRVSPGGALGHVRRLPGRRRLLRRVNAYHASAACRRFGIWRSHELRRLRCHRYRCPSRPRARLGRQLPPRERCEYRRASGIRRNCGRHCRRRALSVRRCGRAVHVVQPTAHRRFRLLWRQLARRRRRSSRIHLLPLDRLLSWPPGLILSNLLIPVLCGVKFVHLPLHSRLLQHLPRSAKTRVQGRILQLGRLRLRSRLCGLLARLVHQSIELRAPALPPRLSFARVRIPRLGRRQRRQCRVRSVAHCQHRRSVFAEARHLYQAGPALGRELHLVDDRRQRQRQPQNGARLAVSHATRRRAVGSSLRLPILENRLQVLAHLGDLVPPCASLRLECRLRDVRGRPQARLERLRLRRRRLLLRPQIALQLLAQRLEFLPVLLGSRRQRLPMSRLL